jgi:discoidin domain receptor family protein 2
MYLLHVSLPQGKYSTKSDVWSFGVTFWEILTFSREQPYEALSEEKVLENISALYQTGRLAHALPQPYNCPRDIFLLIAECWHKVETERPSFREIHLFLQRKNLGFSPKED